MTFISMAFFMTILSFGADAFVTSLTIDALKTRFTRIFTTFRIFWQGAGQI